MHRFFVRPEDISGDTITLRGSDVAHIRTVLRLKSGDTVQVLDGKGSRFEVRLTGVAARQVTGRIEAQAPARTESPVAIHIGQALLKGNKFDTVLRKSVELGAVAVTPIRAQRCVVKVLRTEEAKKIQRWRRIAREAAKQSGRSQVPEVQSKIQSVEAFCKEHEDADLKLIFWEEETQHRLSDCAAPSPPSSIACLTGPEGGFQAREVETARACGFEAVSLGPRILRAETAPVVALSLLQQRWGDL